MLIYLAGLGKGILLNVKIIVLRNLAISRINFFPLFFGVILFVLLLPEDCLAQTKTYTAGAYIIDMGQPTQTIPNGLKPYGLVYALLKSTIPVPVDWSINSAKAKDGIDFTVNGKDYKGGPFIIPSELITPAVLALFTTWHNAGVIIDGPIPVGFTAPVYKTLTIWPKAFLDSQNDPLITPYYANSGIPSSSYLLNANPTMLPQCGSANGTQDVYILPHADPQSWDATWVTALQGFINNGGAMWAGCHAVSAMENIPGCNFLSNNGLVLWGNHSNGTPPYTYTSFGYPLMQFMGILDGATTNGSEEIYVPGASGWRPSTIISVYDPGYTNAGITYPNTAGVVVYGPAFGNKGLVMYEAGHDLTNGASVAQQVAAQRAFFDFLLLAGGQPQTNVTPPSVSNQTATACSGTTFAITPSGASANVTYTWSSPTGTGFTGGSAQTVPQSTISQTLTNTTANSVTAVYTVTPRIGGCLGNTFTLTVTLLAPPLLTSTLTPAAICSGTTFSYTATSAATGATFSWTRAIISGISNGSGSGSNGNIGEILTNTTAAAVVVTYAITTTAYGCSNTQNVTVTVNPLPAAPTAVSATPVSICSGGSATLKATSAGNAIRWYTVATGGTSIGTSASGANFPVTLSTTTTYYAEAFITSSGCSSTTRTAITVTVTPLPVLSSSLTATACSSTPFSYSATSSTTGATFSWIRAVKTGISNAAGSGSNGNISETLINTTTSPVVVIYAITTTANGCSSTQNVSVTVNAAPAVLTLTGSTICTSPGGNGTITSSTSATGVNYQLYNGSAVAQGSALAGTGSGLSWSALAAGTGYYVIGTNSTTSCTSKSSTVNVSTYTNPAATAISNSPVCQGSPLTLTGGPGSMTTYSWTGPLSYTSSSQSPTVSAGATTAMSGTYSLTITDSHGCQGVASVVTTVNAPPAIGSLSVSGTTTCAGSSVVVTVNSSTLVTGTYTVTYNVTGTNTVATTTASMSFTAGSPGTGTFITSALNTVGALNVVHITAIAFSSTPLCVSSVNISTAPFITQNCIAGTCTYDTNGSYNFIAPAGITTITVQAWGAGGGGEKFTQGNDAGAGGGGGGAYTSLTNYSVTSGTLYSIVVGNGGIPGVAGTNSTFNGTTVVAVGGGSNSTAACKDCTNSGGTGGPASACIPSATAFSGGNGGTGGAGGPGKHGGGGGGGSAGAGSAGGTGAVYNGDFGGIGGTAGTGTPGGATGGAGGNDQGKTAPYNGSDGSAPGAGGGGVGHFDNNHGPYTSGSGADGEVIINYTCPFYSLTSTSATSPCIGNAATVTLNGTLPIGTYVVTYSLSGSNTATNFTANMTVTTAGTGTFTTSVLVNSGNTTVTVTNLSSGSCSICSSIISTNNTANLTVNPNSVGGTTAASSPTICYNSTTSITLSGYTGTIQWQQSPDGSSGWSNVTGGSGATSATYTTPGLTTTTYYRAVVTSGACSSAFSTTASVTVNILPTITGTTPASICGTGTLTLGATASAGTINWYPASTGGSSLGTGTSFTTPVLSSTTTYYAEALANGCVSATRTAVTATVNPLPTVSTAVVNPAAVCASGQVIFSATPSAGTITWYDAATNGNIVNVLNPTINTTTTYYAEALANGCVSATRSAVTATMNSLPTVSSASVSPTAVCATGQVVFSASPSAGTITWYDDPTNGNVVTVLNPIISSTTTYYAEASANGCESATRTAVTATVNALPTVSSALVSPAAVCVSGEVVFSATPSTGTITWYDAPANGNVVNVLNPTISTTTTYYAEASANGCVSATRTAVTATVYPLPTVLSASVSPAAVCGSGQVLFSATPSSGIITWYDAATNGNFADDLNPTINKTTTYYAEVSANGCLSATRTAVTATVNSLPTITGTLIVCAGSTTNLTGSGTPALTSPWISATPSVSIVNNSGLVTGVSAGTSVITYTDINGCTVNSTVTVNALPVITIQPTNELDCEGHIVSFNAVATGSGLTYTWQRKYTSGSFADIPLVGEPNVSYPSAGTIRLQNVGNSDAPDLTQYRLVISNSNGCIVTSNAATLTVNEITGINPTATSKTICQGENYSYQVSTNYPANVVSYQWKRWNNPGQWDYVIDGGAVSGATTSQLVFTGATPAESGQYKVTVVFHSSGADCNVTSDSRNRTLTVNATPSCTISGNSSVYSGSINNIFTSTPTPSDNVIHSWSISGNGTIIGSTTGTTVTVTANAIGTITLTNNISRFGCTSSCSTTISVINLPCSVTPTTSVPNGSSTTYTGPAGMDTYAWSVSGNGSITSGIAGQTVTVLAGNTCNSYTLTQTIVKNGATSTCSQTISVTDNILPSFALPAPFTGCVENLYSAIYYGATMDINPDRPDYYTFSHGDTSLDLNTSAFTDNCDLSACLPLQIRWQIDFVPTPDPTPPHSMITKSPVTGTGQPSAIVGTIQFPGDGINFTNVVHSITYWIKDCAGNESLQQTQTITIKPRPNIIKGN